MLYQRVGTKKISTLCTWLVLGLILPVGCGSDGDNDSPPPNTQEASITIDFDGVLQKGISVVFHASDGSVLAHVKTDANGVARSSVGPLGQVTIAHLDDQQRKVLYTFTDVKPGDNLTYSEKNYTWVDVGSADVTMPGNFQGATAYTSSNGGIMSISGEAAGELTVPIGQSCLDDQNHFNFLMIAENAAGAPIAYSHLNDQSVPAPGAGPLSMPAWKTNFSSTNCSFTGLPAITDTVSVQVQSKIENIAYFANSILGNVTSGSASVTTGFPTDFANLGRFDIRAIAGLSGFTAISGILDERPVPASLETNFDSSMLPYVESAEVDTTDAERPVVSWTIGAGGKSADFVQIALGDAVLIWNVRAKAGSGLATWPMLPEELADFRPPEGFMFQVTLFEADQLVGWDDAHLSNKDPQLPSRFSTLVPNFLGPAL